ncbi:MAG: Uncharacterised protein [Rhodospirillaceae bacterium]|nr:MAG: Uncharacterised protein [Rhodospirillaceae bacterium]
MSVHVSRSIETIIDDIQKAVGGGSYVDPEHRCRHPHPHRRGGCAGVGAAFPAASRAGHRGLVRDRQPSGFHVRAEHCRLPDAALGVTAARHGCDRVDRLFRGQYRAGELFVTAGRLLGLCRRCQPPAGPAAGAAARGTDPRHQSARPVRPHSGHRQQLRRAAAAGDPEPGDRGDLRRLHAGRGPAVLLQTQASVPPRR